VSARAERRFDSTVYLRGQPAHGFHEQGALHAHLRARFPECGLSAGRERPLYQVATPTPNPNPNPDPTPNPDPAGARRRAVPHTAGPSPKPTPTPTPTATPTPNPIPKTDPNPSPSQVGDDELYRAPPGQVCVHRSHPGRPIHAETNPCPPRRCLHVLDWEDRRNLVYRDSAAAPRKGGPKVERVLPCTRMPTAAILDLMRVLSDASTAGLQYVVLLTLTLTLPTAGLQ